MHTTVPHYELYRRDGVDLRLPERRGKILVINTFEPMDTDRAREVLKDHFGRLDDLQDTPVHYLTVQRAFPARYLDGRAVVLGTNLSERPGSRIDLGEHFLWPSWDAGKNKVVPPLVVRIHHDRCYVVNNTRRSLPIQGTEERMLPPAIPPGKMREVREGWILRIPHPHASLGVEHHLEWKKVTDFHRAAIEEDTSHLLDHDEANHPEWDALRGEPARRIVRGKYKEAKAIYPLQAAAKLVVPKG